MSFNLPDGLSENHPYFNPAPERATAVECGADEALVVPSYAVKAALTELREYVGRQVKARQNGSEILLGIAGRIDRIRDQVERLEQEREYECPFNDEVDLEESECAHWDCPVCGNERETDTLPEERDPDEEWERRNER